MTFTVTTIINYPTPSTPTFKEWAKTADPVFLDAFPDVAGQNPYDVMIAADQERANAAGLVNRTITNDGNLTVIDVWASEQDWYNAVAAPTSGTVPMLDDNGQPILNPQGQPKYYTPRRYLFKIYSDQYGVTQTVTKTPS